MKNFIDKLKKAKNYPLVIFFFIFIFLFTFVDIIKPDKVFSEMENKYLQERPKFTFTAFAKNEFVPKYEKYINDQFVFRDKWIDLKSRCEYYIGKTENNGIVYGKDGYLFDKVQSVNEKQAQKNMKIILEYIKKYKDNEFKFALIPNSYDVLKNKIPYKLSLYDQQKLIDKVYDEIQKLDNVECLDIKSAMLEHANEYIYYKTDHHWTTLGAYYAYEVFMNSVNKESVALSELNAHEIKDFYGTYFSKAKKFDAESDVITYYDVDIDKMTFADKVFDGIYDLEKFEKRDKYAAFLYGNNDLTHIIGKDAQNKSESEKSTVLVIKDSFGNSFVPYLTYNYDEIYVLDLRSNSEKVSEIMQKYEFDDILIMYSVGNFIDDSNIIKLGY